MYSTFFPRYLSRQVTGVGRYSRPDNSGNWLFPDRLSEDFFFVVSINKQEPIPSLAGSS